MKVKYICHSSFFLEWENCYWLFDYYKGELPTLNQDKELVIFVSHSHGDHYNPIIFTIGKNHPNTRYLISNDVRLSREKCFTMGISDEIFDRITFVKPNLELELKLNNGDRLAVHTLKSTDAGVAFLINFQGKQIFHAGDLNCWVWKEETKQYNNNMTANFNLEIKKMKGYIMDIAFVPLDPRQEEMYALGINELLSMTHIKNLFPMHFWENYSIIQKFKREFLVDGNEDFFREIYTEGQEWELTI